MLQDPAVFVLGLGQWAVVCTAAHNSFGRINLLFVEAWSRNFVRR